MPQNDHQAARRSEYRIQESWRIHACCAGLLSGASVFLLGAGLAVPLCGNSAWIASLAAIPSSALTAALARRRLAAGISRAGTLFLACGCLMLSLFACAGLIVLAENSLLSQTRGIYIAAMTVLFAVLLAAAGSGCARLCFLCRLFLPLSVIFFAVLSLPCSDLRGVFPLLGLGGKRLCFALVPMALSGCSSAILLFPPKELEGRQDAFAHLPGAGFFARRAATGAAAGCAAVFLLCAGNTPSALTSESLWGMRLLMIAGGAHQGLFDTLTLLAMICAMFLFASQTLAVSCRSLIRLLPIKEHTAVIALGALMLAVLFALAAYGFDAAIIPGTAAAPLAALSLICRKRKKEDAA